MMDQVQDVLLAMAPPFGALIVSVFVLLQTRALLERHFSSRRDKLLSRQLIMATVIIFCLLLFVISLPNETGLRGQVMGLTGILMSGAIALSSTTFLGNAIAGVMLRSVRSYRPGDFISVNGHRGRVSGRGLFHTEIQSADKDLTTLPNLFLATNPVKVTNVDGTVIKAEVSIGYDEPRRKVEDLLLQAAEKAELSDPFVYIIALGDFSVIYQVSGVLNEVTRFLSTQSRLNGYIIDLFHEAEIEIVSPTFMNTRNVARKKFLATTILTPEEEAAELNAPEPEIVIFDKALQAELLEEQRSELAKVRGELTDMADRLKKSDDDAEKERLTKSSSTLQKRKERLKLRIERMAEKMSTRK